MLLTMTLGTLLRLLATVAVLVLVLFVSVVPNGESQPAPGPVVTPTEPLPDPQWTKAAGR